MRDYVGQSVERIEDAWLLTGRGAFADDLGSKPGTLHAAILRSPHAHADVLAIDVTAALAQPGVRAITPALPARLSNVMSSSPNTSPVAEATTCCPTFRDHSRCIRSWRLH